MNVSWYLLSPIGSMLCMTAGAFGPEVFARAFSRFSTWRVRLRETMAAALENSGRPKSTPWPVCDVISPQK